MACYFLYRFEGEMRGPKFDLRLCRSLCGGYKCLCIHNCNNSCSHGTDLSAFYITVEHFEKPPSYPLNDKQMLCSLLYFTPARDLIRMFSTTPDCEDKRFGKDLRRALLQFMRSFTGFDGAE